MRKLNYGVLVIVCLMVSALAGCKYSKEYKLVKGGDKFTMMVPSWVKEDKTLKPGAEFQYDNRFRNFYAIGEVQAKDSTSGIAPAMVTNLNLWRKAMAKPVVDDSSSVTIGGLEGARVEISGQITGETIYVSEVVLAGKNGFYHLSIWTRTADRKLKFKDDIDKILNSFKEL